MNRLKKSIFICMLAIALTTLLTAGVAQAAVSTGAKWSIVPSPNVAKFNDLLSVAAISATDAWAVGHYDMVGSPDQILIEHWNGTSWQVTPNPNPGLNAILYGVAAVSANDVWAVGNSFPGNTPIQTLIEHWNGSSWQIVPSPNVAGNDNGLRGVAAVSANDVWAVGNFSGSVANQTLIEHWNGTSWQIVSSPNPGSFSNGLFGVSAVSANDIWAVGNFDGNGPNQTLIEHWNGTGWQAVSSPNVGSLDNFLLGIAAVSASSAWAVGYSANGNGPNQALIEHWNGTSWQVVSSPSPGSLVNELLGVTAVSASNAWAVGFFQNSSSPSRTLIEHWNGASWTVVPSPNVDSSGNQLESVAAVSATDIWAVGNYDKGNGHFKTVIEHRN